ncbi:PEP-CTERM sorting domain-containing protein [Nodularia chucula]|uniref:PEP-CTERM sorting domain-containing protein n=1 Tax=Nodularia chucula TaxID=3093667 RepID=UPI0039C6B0FA
MNSLTKFLSQSAFTLVGLGLATVPAQALVITTNNNAGALAGGIFDSTQAQITGAVYNGAPVAAGTFTGGLGIFGIDTGLILSTGNVNLATNPSLQGQEPPGTGNFPNEDQFGDPTLTALLPPGGRTRDAASLIFDFIPTTDTVEFRYVLASEEYPPGTGLFNDVFAFFLNGDEAGNNIALVPGTETPVSIRTINANTNSGFFRNNIPDNLNIGYTGLTSVLTARATGLLPGETNTLRLAIADGGDVFGDTSVFIEAGVFSDPGPDPDPDPDPDPVDPGEPVTSVPEPTTMLGLLAFGAFGASTALKRKQQQKGIAQV